MCVKLLIFFFSMVLITTESFLTETNSLLGSSAKVARYLVHNSNWTSVGTLSTKFPGFPMVNIKSIADSPSGANSTGNIYFLLTDLDLTSKDLSVNNKLTIMLTEDQSLACTVSGIDPMEPTCARVILTGKLYRLQPGSDEHVLASEAFYSRHPASINWPHDFYLSKMTIENIIVIAKYGGASEVTPEEYYNANYDWSDM